MRWRHFLAVLLPVVGLLAGCIASDVPFFSDRRAATPLPDAFVLASEEEGETNALRFDRDADRYLTRQEDGRMAGYRLFEMQGNHGGRRFFIGMETEEGDGGANYGLVELAGAELLLHNFDAKEVAIREGVPDDGDRFGARFRTEADLVQVFEAAVAAILDGREADKAGRTRIYDLSDPAQAAEADKLLEKAQQEENDGAD